MAKVARLHILSVMTATDAYRAAKPTFISTDAVIDGAPLRVLFDPATGLRMAIPVKDAGLLPWLFKSRWIAHHEGSTPCAAR